MHVVRFFGIAANSLLLARASVLVIYLNMPVRTLSYWCVFIVTIPFNSTRQKALEGDTFEVVII